MANGTTISEIKTLISDPDAQMTTKTGLRLLLTVSSEMWEKMEHFNAVLEQIATKERQHDTDIAELKSHNIIMWIGKNPKSALVVLVTSILGIDLIVDVISWKDAFNLLVEIFKKNAGV
jgi:hypothetical protein